MENSNFNLVVIIMFLALAIGMNFLLLQALLREYDEMNETMQDCDQCLYNVSMQYCDISNESSNKLKECEHYRWCQIKSITEGFRE